MTCIDCGEKVIGAQHPAVTPTEDVYTMLAAGPIHLRCLADQKLAAEIEDEWRRAG